MTHKIALVDDDRNILTSVSIALEDEGYQVYTYKDGEEALQGLKRLPVDLAVLDIKMPRMTGMELLEKIREESNLPVIFLSSKDDEIDQLMGLRHGADDYITKPFSQKLLIERIRALLRRVEADTTTSVTSADILTRGHLVLDNSRYECRWKDQPLKLTVTEYMLIYALAKFPGHVLTRDQLMDKAYSDDVYVDDRTIDSHIKRLRKKFKSIDDDFSHIETLYGMGYRFKAE